MKRFALLLTTVALAGCGEAPQATTKAPGGGASPAVHVVKSAEGSAGKTEEMPVAESKTAAPAAGGSELGPQNTKILFICAHVGEKPDPRQGGFEKFSGKLAVDPDSKLPSAISFEIATDSIWTEIAGLTTHLKGPDFFDVKEYPEIKFQSTQVEVQDAAAGNVLVTGDLTLHGVTKPIKVPITAANTDKASAEFTIDRTEFGMTYGEGKIENKVSLTVVIGEKTEPKAPANPNP